MLPEQIYPILGIAVVALLILGAWLARRPQREALKKLAGRFEGRVSWISGAFRGKYQGFEFKINLISPDKHNPPRLSIHIRHRYQFNLRIYRETALTRVGKRLGLVREVQINDSSFDSQFLIFSNRPVQAVHFLSMSAKNTLRELFSRGFDSFSLDMSGVTARKPEYSLSEDLAPDRIEELLRKLLSLTGGAV